MMQICSDLTCLIFLHCVFSNAASNCQLELMHSCTGRTCLMFLHCAFLKCLLILSAWIDTKLHWFQLCGFFNCAFLNASSNCQFEMMQIRTDRTCLIFLHCAFLKCLLILSAWINAKPHWLHLFDFSQMCVFKCLPKMSTWFDAKTHYLNCTCLICLHCAFSKASSNCQLELMQSRTGHTFLIF